MPTLCTAPATPERETIVTGDALCVTGFDKEKKRPIVKRATRANLSASKTVFGVAQSDAVFPVGATEGSVLALVSGEVADSDITLLGNVGGSRIVVTDPMKLDAKDQCRLKRIDLSPTPEEFVVGTCDEDGNLVIQPRHCSIETGFQTVFNVRAYGAVPDWSRGRTGTISKDDNVLIVNDISDLRVGQRLLIGTNSGTYEILGIFGKKVTLKEKVGDGATDERVSVDNLPYFKAALEAMESNGYRAGKLVADGHFYLSETLHIHQTIVFEGAGKVETDSGSPSRSAPGTWLIFPRDVDGIILHTALHKLGGADQTILRNLTVYCNHVRVPPPGYDIQPLPPDLGQVGIGVRINTPVQLDNVSIENFGEHGILVESNTVLVGAANSNASGTYLMRCKVGNCGGNGYHFVGIDTNGCLISCCNASVNFGWGFFDETASGNTFLACLGEANNGYADDAPYSSPSRDFKTISEANSSMFISCMSGEQAKNELASTSMAIGGALALEHMNIGSPFLLTSGGIVSRNALIHTHPDPEENGPNAVQIEFGQRDSSEGDLGVLSFSLPGRGDYNKLSWDETTGWWGLDNSSPNLTSIHFPTTVVRPRRVAPLFSNGIFYGAKQGAFAPELGPFASAQITNHIVGAEVPTSGTWEKGDIIWNSAPDPTQEKSQFIGWVCTEAGTNGTLNAGGVNGSIKAGTDELMVDDPTGLDKWQYITITDVPGINQIISDVISKPIDPNNPDGPKVHTVQIYPKAKVSSGPGATITFALAVFKTFGSINP